MNIMGRFYSQLSYWYIASCCCRLFEFFVSVFDELIRDARKEGQFDSGIVDIKASTIELNGSPKV